MQVWYDHVAAYPLVLALVLSSENVPILYFACEHEAQRMTFSIKHSCTTEHSYRHIQGKLSMPIKPDITVTLPQPLAEALHTDPHHYLIGSLN